MVNVWMVILQKIEWLTNDNVKIDKIVFILFFLIQIIKQIYVVVI